MIVCIIFFLIPFIIFGDCENLYSKLSLGFSALGSIATLITLVIAIMLFDRFGIEAKNVVKQFEKVIELRELLKGKNIIIKSNKITYFIHPKQNQFEGLKNLEPYKIDSQKKILIAFDEYSESVDSLLTIKSNDSLPEEIKAKMEFWDVGAISEIADPSEELFVKLFLNKNTSKIWGKPFPEMTFEEFNQNLLDLDIEIEKWLKRHSEI